MWYNSSDKNKQNKQVNEVNENYDLVFSKSKLFIDKDLYEILKFCYAVSPDKFRNRFLSEARIQINNNSDVNLLIELIKRGGDKKGEIKDKLGIPIRFDGEEIIRSIIIDEDDLRNVRNIKFID